MNKLPESLLTINIIYVKGVVSQVLPFLTSLLDHSNCSFRLVSNGCSPEEEETLIKYSESDKRLTFYSINSKTILLHHEALHLLLNREESPYFAFMDSDILATGEFCSNLLSELEDKEAVFTGLPLWHESSEMSMPRSFKIVGGRFVKSHKGHLLGLSYAAVYRREPLVEYINASGIDLRRYKWAEIPKPYQSILRDMELDKSFYDTAKLLNILWQYRGAQMSFCNVSSLIHLGGISGKAYQAQAKPTLRVRFSKLMPLTIKSIINILLMRFDAISLKEAINMSKLVRKREATAQLLGKLIGDDNFSTSNNDFKHFPPELVNKIKPATEEISALIANSKR